MKKNSLIAGILFVSLSGLTGCVTGKVSQEDLAQQWHKLSNESLRKTFCNTTTSGFGKAEWKVFWSSDCHTGKLEVGPNGEYKTQYRTVEILDDKYCITAEKSEKKNCYSLFERDGKYLDINAAGKQSMISIKDGIPEKKQLELGAFNAK